MALEGLDVSSNLLTGKCGKNVLPNAVCRILLLCPWLATCVNYRKFLLLLYRDTWYMMTRVLCKPDKFTSVCQSGHVVCFVKVWRDTVVLCDCINS